MALGDAKGLDDFRSAVKNSYASAVAAVILFFYQGPRRAVLINYPSMKEIKEIFNHENSI